jgi:hypothetical protein
MTEQQKPNSVYGKIAKIMGEIGNIEKDARNQQQKYDYVSESAISSAVQTALSKNNVAIFPNIISKEIHEGEPTAKKAIPRHCLLKMEFVIADADTGDIVTCVWEGESIDYADKSIGKAVTLSRKSFLRALFNIPTGDDPDGDSPQYASTQSNKKNTQPDTQFQDGFLIALAANTARELKITQEQAEAGIDSHVKAGNITPEMNMIAALDFIKTEAAKKAPGR